VAAGGGDHGDVLDAELVCDVGVGAVPGEVLLAQPVGFQNLATSLDLGFYAATQPA
jgi:hypothetical protein